MGYYTGSGVTVSGSLDVAPEDTVYAGATLTRERKRSVTVVVKNGVSLATAQAASAGSYIRCGDLTNGDFSWATNNAVVITKAATYSRVADSNLYTLTETTEDVRRRLSAKNGAGSLDKGDWAVPVSGYVVG